MTRTVVVKGRFGMGGRLAVLLSAWRYAIDTERNWWLTGTTLRTGGLASPTCMQLC